MVLATEKHQFTQKKTEAKKVIWGEVGGGGTDWQREKNTDRTEKIDTESGMQSLSSKSESKQDKSLRETESQSKTETEKK